VPTDFGEGSANDSVKSSINIGGDP